MTSANRFEKENPLFLDLSEGTKYVLNAPGKDWNLDLSIPRVRICMKERESKYQPQNTSQSWTISTNSMLIVTLMTRIIAEGNLILSNISH